MIFEIKIILPPADVVELPRHRRARSLVQRNLRHDRRQAGRFRGSCRGPGGPIEVIIFGKDRACQLEALLRSMARFVAYPHRITVLYTASHADFERGYDVLQKGYASVTWVREADFKTDLMRLIDKAGALGARHVMFLVDDIVFTRRFDGEQMIELLQEDDVLALSLRLGDNIRHCPPRGTATAPPDFRDGRRWAWRDVNPAIGTTLCPWTATSTA